MKRRTRTVVFWALGVLAAAVIFSIFLMPFSMDRQQNEIVLPEQETTDVDMNVQIQEYNQKIVESIDIDTENVQQVIATLQRPQQYHYQAETTYMWSEGSTTLRTEGWIKPGMSKVVQYSAEGLPEKYTLTDDDTVYIWGQGEDTYFQGNNGAFTADDAGHIPTYETILLRDPEDIIDGGFVLYEQTACVYAKTRNFDSGYTEMWYIAVDSGLLIAQENTDAGEPVSAVRMTALDTEEQDSSVYVLPGDTGSIQ